MLEHKIRTKGFWPIVISSHWLLWKQTIFETLALLTNEGQNAAFIFLKSRGFFRKCCQISQHYQSILIFILFSCRQLTWHWSMRLHNGVKKIWSCSGWNFHISAISRNFQNKQPFKIILVLKTRVYFLMCEKTIF